jgi:hypothetical protein
MMMWVYVLESAGDDEDASWCVAGMSEATLP